MSKSEQKAEQETAEKTAAGYFRTVENAKTAVSGHGYAVPDQDDAAHTTLNSNDKSEYSSVGGQRVSHQHYLQNSEEQLQNTASANAGSYHGQNQTSSFDQYNYQSANSDANAQYAQNSQTGMSYGSSSPDPMKNNDGTDGQYANGSYDTSYGSNYGAQPGYDDQTRYSYPSSSQPGQPSTQNGYSPEYYNDPSYGYNGGHDAGAYAADQQGAYYNSEQQDAGYYDSEFDEDYEEDDERKGRLGVLLSVLVGAIAIGGGVTYAYQNGYLNIGDFGNGSQNPPVLSADKDPVKYRPENPGGKIVNNGKKLIYSRVSPDNANPESSQGVRLIPRQEDLKQPQQQGNAGSSTSSVTGSVSGQQQSEGGPRKVKTLVVRPDGTFDGSSRQTQRITPPKNPAKEATTARSSANTNTGVGISLGDYISSSSNSNATNTTPTSQPSGTSQQNTAAPAQKPKIVRNIQPSIIAQPQQQESSTIARQGSAQTRNNVNNLVLNSPQQPAQNTNNIRTAALSPGAQATGTQASSERFAVQIAARRDQTSALETFANLQQRYPSLLNSYRPIIQRADLGAKGVWYRLRIGPLTTRSSATDLCERLKASGVRNCFVRPL